MSTIRAVIGLAGAATLFAITTAAASAAEPEKKPEAPFQRVPDKLATWELTLSQSAVDAARPYGVRSDGQFVEMASLNRSQRPRPMKSMEGPLMSAGNLQMSVAGARAAINGFYISNPGCDRVTHDAGLISVRLAAFGRSIEIGADPEDVVPIGIAPQYAKVIETVNTSLGPGKGRDRIHFPANWQYRVRQEEKRTGVREIVPMRVTDWRVLEIGVVDGDLYHLLRLWKSDGFQGGLEVRRYNAKGDNSYPVHVKEVTTEEQDAVFECVRLIVNGLTLRESSRPEIKSSGVRCTAGIQTECRSIRVEFDVDDDTPKEWTSRITATLEKLRGRLLDQRGKAVEFPTIP